jgi:hypothetical protein
VIVSSEEEGNMFGENRRLRASACNVGGDRACAAVGQYLNRCRCRDGELRVGGILARSVGIDRVIGEPVKGILVNCGPVDATDDASIIVVRRCVNVLKGLADCSKLEARAG